MVKPNYGTITLKDWMLDSLTGARVMAIRGNVSCVDASSLAGFKLTMGGNSAEQKLLDRLYAIEDWRIWHSGVNINLDSEGQCEISAWWPDPSKDDSSPGYKPHISELRVLGATEIQALERFVEEAEALSADST